MQHARLDPVQVRLGKGDHFGIVFVHHLLGLLQFVTHFLDALSRSPDRVQTIMLLAESFELVYVGGNRRVGELTFDLGGAGKRGREPRFHDLRFLFGGLLVPLTEPLDPACRIDQLLFAGEERMALSADFHVNIRPGGPGDERVSAGARNSCALIVGMNSCLHETLHCSLVSVEI